MIRKHLLALALLVASAAAASATTCSSYPYTLTNGQTADANQVMSNFNLILNCANASLAPSASPTFTGTLTLPDGSAWNSGGLSSVLKLGIGTAVGTEQVDAVLNTNGVERWKMVNSNAGTAAAMDFQENATTGSAGGIQTFGDSWTTSGPQVRGGTMVYANGSGGLTLASINAGPIAFSLEGQTPEGYMICASACTQPNIFVWGSSSLADLGGAQIFQVNGTSYFKSKMMLGAANATLGSGNGEFSSSTSVGLFAAGFGSVDDVEIGNDSEAVVLHIPHGTTTLDANGNVNVAGNLAVTGTGQPFTTKFTDTAQALPALGATLTRPHGLAAAPFNYDAFLIETNAAGNCGYAQNNTIKLAASAYATGGYGAQVWADATNVYFVNGTTALNVLNGSNGVSCTLTQADWNVILKAWE